MVMVFLYDDDELWVVLELMRWTRMVVGTYGAGNFLVGPIDWVE